MKGRAFFRRKLFMVRKTVSLRHCARFPSTQAQSDATSEIFLADLILGRAWHQRSWATCDYRINGVDAGPLMGLKLGQETLVSRDDTSFSATRTTLLRRVADFSDAQGWTEFDALYRPMLIRYAKARRLNSSAAEEVAQQCLVAILAQIRRFKRTRSFRGWLRAMVNHKVSDYLSKQRKGTIDLREHSPSEPVETDPAELWMREWNAAHLRKLVESLRDHFAAHTLRAFELYVLEEKPVDEICSMLGLTSNQVYVAKNRVTRHLREAHGESIQDLYGNSK